MSVFPEGLTAGAELAGVGDGSGEEGLSIIFFRERFFTLSVAFFGSGAFVFEVESVGFGEAGVPESRGK